MGEIAEMMLDGTLCQSCGVYIGPGDGYPVSCADCANEAPKPEKPKPGVITSARRCKVCGKRMKNAQAVANHTLDVHGLARAQSEKREDRDA